MSTSDPSTSDPGAPVDPFRNLHSLYAKVEIHSQRVTQAYAKNFACKKGCAGCCDSERSVSAIEHAHVARAVALVEPATLARLQAAKPGKDCSMLLDGQCAVYEARPLICRTHGLPLLIDQGKTRQVVDVCPLNFKDGALGALPAVDLLTLSTVNSILVAVNALYCKEESGSPRWRGALKSLLN